MKEFLPKILRSNRLKNTLVPMRRMSRYLNGERIANLHMTPNRSPPNTIPPRRYEQRGKYPAIKLGEKADERKRGKKRAKATLGELDWVPCQHGRRKIMR